VFFFNIEREWLVVEPQHVAVSTFEANGSEKHAASTAVAAVTLEHFVAH
jgi:hypothetical protein